LVEHRRHRGVDAGGVHHRAVVRVTQRLIGWLPSRSDESILVDGLGGRRIRLAAGDRALVAPYLGSSRPDAAPSPRASAILRELERLEVTPTGARAAAIAAARRSRLDATLEARTGAVLAVAARIPAYRSFAGRAFESWPTMNKSDIRRQFPDGLLPEGERADARLYVRRSAGTTSQGVQSFREHAEDEEQEHVHTGFSLLRSSGIGCRFATRHCAGGACPLDPPKPGEPRHRMAGNVLHLDLRDVVAALSEHELEEVARAIEEANPDYIGADASYLAPFLEWLGRRGAALPAPAYVQTTFAFASGIHRSRIATALSCPVIDVYSSSELGPVALACAAGRLHVIEPSVRVEVLDAEGKGVPPGALGELTITTVARTVAPLIRYRTGDLVRVFPDACPCGAVELALQVEGRAADTLLLADERWTTRAIDEVVSGCADGVRHWRLVQTAKNSAELSVVGEEAGARAAADALRERFGPTVHVDVRVVPRIAPEPSLKYVFTASRLAAPPA
jgi:phenylacetate-CoA ligase